MDPRHVGALLAIGAALATGSARAGGNMVSSTHPGTTVSAETEVLPTPHWPDGATLAGALSRRRSVREFGTRALTTTELSTLLWSAQGLTDSEGHRTAPSAGALYPLRLYLVLASGVYRYEPFGHRLTLVRRGNVRDALWQASLRQDPVRRAPALIVVAGSYAVTAVRYGSMARRYVDLEAGHAAQNLLLSATALGLAAVPIGAFDPARVKAALGLPASEDAIEIVPVGAMP